MNALVRWGKFNLVGAAGVVVQLAALALFDRCAPGHILLCTAAAIEIALLHNFAWHVRFTWRDHRCGSPRWAQWMRFQLSNGLVSLAGNLALMHLLVDGAHVPVLAANAIAIGVCSVVNFGFGDLWVFGQNRMHR